MLLLAVHPAAAQVVRGTITDRLSGEPLPSASVLVLNPDSSLRAVGLTDEKGEFRLRPEPGRFILRVERLGFATVWSQPLEMERTDTLTFEVRLPRRAVTLDSLAVVGEARDPSGFYGRRKVEWGVFIGPDEIAHIRPTRVTDLVQHLPGFEVYNQAEGAYLWVSSRGRGCSPTVYLDSHLVANGTATRIRDRERKKSAGVVLDALVNASQIRAVEVYQNPIDAPLEFRPTGEVAGGGDCAVVVLWTYAGFGE